jgi:hypothetical protein
MHPLCALQFLTSSHTEIRQLKQNPRSGFQLSDDESLRKEDGEELWVSSSFRLQGAAHVGGMSPPATAGTPAAGTTLATARIPEKAGRPSTAGIQATNCRDSTGQSLLELTVHFSMHLSHGRRNFKDTNPNMSFSLVILFGVVK